MKTLPSPITIGVLDSGVGGLSIFHHLQTSLPEHQFIYYADSQHFPYSEKPVEEVLAALHSAVENLLDQGCQIIVIACNTATVLGINYLRHTFTSVPFVGTVPAVKPASLETPPQSTVLILASQNTANSRYLQELIKPLTDRTDFLIKGSTELVEAVEADDQSAINTTLEAIAAEYSQTEISGIVIGCTHFSAVKNQLRASFGPNIQLFEPQTGIEKQLKKILAELKTEE